MADVSVLVQQIEELKKQVAELTQRTMAGNRVQTAQGLSDIDPRLGSIQAGELRFGTKGSSFTGLKMIYPPIDSDSAVLGAQVAGANEFFINESGLAVARRLRFKAVTADPDYEDGYVIVYFYSSGGDDRLTARGKVGATETQATLADISP